MSHNRRLRRFFAFASVGGLLFCGCGDADVCGAYNGGNVAVVKSCQPDNGGANNPGDQASEDLFEP